MAAPEPDAAPDREPDTGTARGPETGAARGRGRVARVTMVEGGPVLVEGPVEIESGDGERVRSDRPVVALCACRRSKRYPFCDTSHRRRTKPPR